MCVNFIDDNKPLNINIVFTKVARFITSRAERFVDYMY